MFRCIKLALNRGGASPNQIQPRKNGKRRVVVTSKQCRGRDLGSVREELREIRLVLRIELPEGTGPDYGGTVRALISSRVAASV